MTRPESLTPTLPEREGEPLFAEAWQAEVLGLAFSLIEAGRIDNADWSKALGAAIESRRLAGEPDDGESYYGACLDALEQVVRAAGLADAGELAGRKADWTEAYRRTPHGRPVKLSGGGSP